MFLPDRDNIEYSRTVKAVFIVMANEIVVWDKSLEAERIFYCRRVMLICHVKFRESCKHVFKELKC